ncbi:P63C domain-containing protein [Mucilaginibacter humi]|uniref:P63C domain-containing protein n=1 Tax=Mucilaginibacter humi TaxID=2732510 RepID=UPI003743B63B
MAAELLPWQKRFPDEFYKEIFRLNGWDYTVNGIKNRPGVIGTWTKNLIYNLLPNGVLAELEKRHQKVILEIKQQGYIKVLL